MTVQEVEVKGEQVNTLLPVHPWGISWDTRCSYSEKLQFMKQRKCSLQPPKDPDRRSSSIPNI